MTGSVIRQHNLQNWIDQGKNILIKRQIEEKENQLMKYKVMTS